MQHVEVIMQKKLIVPRQQHKDDFAFKIRLQK